MKAKLLTGALTSFLFVAGCASDEETPEETQQETAPDVEQNEDLTKAVKDEDGVMDGQVYEQDGSAIGTLLLDKEVKDADAKALAEKYAEEIKQEYPELPVNVQAVRNGKNVANIQLEK
ncbi:hypothetical protein BTO30_01570 [Domibacillus antri]|uniref:Lipoprotein n=1 Tax=Domibacillus antri TaxID=1714264 RepID=A0A1Q8Q9W4_9BACI|nr:hypothetical protein [Domibacillus antri]OLN24128.1 hypothetical protein BTO30_01570 [Domibacillus antri]